MSQCRCVYSRDVVIVAQLGGPGAGEAGPINSAQELSRQHYKEVPWGLSEMGDLSRAHQGMPSFPINVHAVPQ